MSKPDNFFKGLPCPIPCLLIYVPIIWAELGWFETMSSFLLFKSKLFKFDTVVYLWLFLWECQSPAWWWCYLRCSTLADGWPLVLPPPLPSLLVGWVYSLAPKWLNYRSLHTSFFTLSTNHLAAIMMPNFLQPPQITFTFSTNHLAANIIHFLQPPQITVT